MRALIIILSVLSLWLGGCAKKQVDVGDNSPAYGTVPGAPTGQFDDGLSGGVANFFPAGSTDHEKARTMEDYVYERPLNNPGEYKIRLSLERDEESDLYKGNVSISYYDDGVFHQSSQSTGSEIIDVRYNKYDGQKENKYNKWLTLDGKTMFRAMFQDEYGSVIVIIDDVIDLGDGLGPDDDVNGRIYYKNFGNVYAPPSPTKCWFVTRGPYSCGAGYDDENRITPEGGYTLLGEFRNLSLNQAFKLN